MSQDDRTTCPRPATRSTAHRRFGRQLRRGRTVGQYEFGRSPDLGSPEVYTLSVDQSDQHARPARPLEFSCLESDLDRLRLNDVRGKHLDVDFPQELAAL